MRYVDSGTGAMAQSLSSAFKSIALDGSVEALAALTAEKQSELLVEYVTKGMTEVDALTEIATMKFAGSINIVASRSYKAALGTSLSAGIVSQLIAANKGIARKSSN